MNTRVSKKSYLALLLVSAVLVVPACSKENKMLLTAGAVMSGVVGGIHFLGHKLGIRRHGPAPSDGAEQRANTVSVKKFALLPRKAVLAKKAVLYIDEQISIINRRACWRHVSRRSLCSNCCFCAAN